MFTRMLNLTNKSDAIVSTRRSSSRRRATPGVDHLEGRQLLSTTYPGMDGMMGAPTTAETSTTNQTTSTSPGVLYEVQTSSVNTTITTSNDDVQQTDKVIAVAMEDATDDGTMIA